jgi:hypothetical protein
MITDNYMLLNCPSVKEQILGAKIIKSNSD